MGKRNDFDFAEQQLLYRFHICDTARQFDLIKMLTMQRIYTKWLCFAMRSFLVAHYITQLLRHAGYTEMC